MMKNVIKLIFLLFDLVIGCCVLLHAQVDEKLKADIVSTATCTVRYRSTRQRLSKHSA